MIARLRSWWQIIKQHQVTIGIVAIVLAFFVSLIIVGYQFDWTGFGAYNKVTITHTISGTNAGTVTKTEEYQPGKGLWDWLQLLGILAIPAVVGLGTVWFTSRQTQASETNRAQQIKESEANREKRHQTDLEIADKNRERQQQTDLQIAADKQREAALKEYFDKMSELLLHENLRGSTKYAQVRNIARVWTLTTLRRLDGVRKGTVLQFLHESGLIDAGNETIIDLDGADLSGASLRTDLHVDNLAGTNMEGADLHQAYCAGAELVGAKLRGADLSGANLTETDMFGADLSYADLRGALVTDVQLEKTKSLEGATMPDGTIHA